MFGSFPSKLDGEMFHCALHFGQSSYTFYEISAFFKHNFCLARLSKMTPVNLIFIYISPLKSLTLVLILSANLDGHRALRQGVFPIPII